MAKMKVTKTKKILENITYHLSKEIKYNINYENSKEVSRGLSYTGKKIYDYPVHAVYCKDLSNLKTKNPFWEDNVLVANDLPDPEEVDLNDVILMQYARHALYDVNKNPIPVIERGDYIEAGLHNRKYDLIKLREYFLTHPKVTYVSEILDIPYYNAEDGRKKYLKVHVLPDSDIILESLEKNYQLRRLLFNSFVNGVDYLGIDQFVKKSYERD